MKTVCTLTFLSACVLLIVFSTPAESQTASTATFQSEHKSVTIERFDPGTKGSHTAVIMVHGAGGPEGNWRKSSLPKALTAANYVVFAPHYFEGSGGNWQETGDTKQFIAYVRTLNDAAGYVMQQPGVRKGAIGLLGFSLGGYLVLGLAEEESSHPPPQPGPEIKAVIEMCGGIPQFAVDRMTSMPPVLILHGDKDDTVSVENAYELEKLLKKKSLPYEIKIYPGQGHGFEGASLQDANERTVSFLKSHLQ